MYYGAHGLPCQGVRKIIFCRTNDYVVDSADETFPLRVMVNLLRLPQYSGTSDAPAHPTASVPITWEKPPAGVTACPSEVHVWRIRAHDPNVAAVWGSLSRAEHERASRFRSHAAQAEFIVSRGALRSIISNYLGVVPQAVEFTQNPYGKPELAPAHGSKLRFNISHSHGLILEAVSLKEVGIDVEFIRPEVSLSDLGTRVFSCRETVFLAMRPPGERVRQLFQCWTRKEALVKAFGQGLSDSIAQIPALPSVDNERDIRNCEVSDLSKQWAVQDLNAADGFAAAMAIADRNCTVRFWDWSS
jgi:4'-phosphopantetheinyl transferase